MSCCLSCDLAGICNQKEGITGMEALTPDPGCLKMLRKTAYQKISLQ